MRLTVILAVALGALPVAGAAGDAPVCGGPAADAPVPARARAMAPPTGECEITASGPIEIPFRMLNHHVLIPVSVNGSPPLDVILDTGMPVHGVMLHPGPEVDAIPFDTEGAPQVAVAGDGANAVQRAAVNVTLELPGVTFRGQLAIIAPPCGPRAPRGPDEAKGVIGLSLFDNFVVTFDHDRNVLVLTRPGEFAYEGPGVRLPIELGGPPVPQLKCTLDTGGRTVPLTLVVDTGATHALSLMVGPESAIAPPPDALPLVVGYSYWGELSGTIGRASSLRLGEVALDDILVTYVQAGAQGVPPCAGDGLLGNVTLRRFNVTFDYARREMILEPNSHFLEPFEFNMSGMAVVRAADGGFEVRRVFPDTPASEAGIEPGDVIVAVDGRPAGDVPGEAMRAALERDGASLELDIVRGGETIRTIVRLRRLV